MNIAGVSMFSAGYWPAIVVAAVAFIIYGSVIYANGIKTFAPFGNIAYLYDLHAKPLLELPLSDY